MEDVNLELLLEILFKTGINSSFSPGVKVGHNSTIGSGVLLYDDVPSDTRVLVKQNHIIQDKNKKK